MTELLLVRHGETDWNVDRRFQGHADPPLNDAGREQARALANELSGENVDAVYTSDLARARQTAEIVGAALGVPVTKDVDLREIDVGSWRGLTREELGERAWDGETYEAHSGRVLRAIRAIVRAHPEGRVLIVTHGGSLRRICEAIGDGERPHFSSCELMRLPSQQLD